MAESADGRGRQRPSAIVDEFFDFFRVQESNFVHEAHEEHERQRSGCFVTFVLSVDHKEKSTRPGGPPCGMKMGYPQQSALGMKRIEERVKHMSEEREKLKTQEIEGSERKPEEQKP